MSNDARFEEHTEKVISKVRQKVGWLFRTFYTRRLDIMKQLWKTLIQCHIDYCSQLICQANQRECKLSKSCLLTFLQEFRN